MSATSAQMLPLLRPHAAGPVIDVEPAQAMAEIGIVFLPGPPDAAARAEARLLS